MAKNPLVHWEIMGPDARVLADFYGSVFDWAPEGSPALEDYFQVGDDDSGLSGAVGQGPAEMPSYLTLYVGVDDVDEQLAKVTAAGGETVMPRTVIPGVVAFGMFKDPAGNMVGLAENETPAAE